MSELPPYEWRQELWFGARPPGAGHQPKIEDRHIYVDMKAARAGNYTSYKGLEYRAACWGCSWTGPTRDAENTAVEDAHDHAFPGWRDVPIVPGHHEWFSTNASKPNEKKRDEVLRMIRETYPAGWIERHGPVRSVRGPHGTRHVPGYSPTGGYEMAVAESEVPAAPTQLGLL